MAFTTLFANRAVVRMIGHHHLDVQLAEVLSVFGVEANTHSLRHFGHAGHDHAAPIVIRILIELHRALTA